MEKHLMPLLYSLIGIVGQTTITGTDGTEAQVNQVYTLLLKILLWGLCLGWIAAIGLGVFTINKMNNWAVLQESINKSVNDTLITYGEKQKTNIACIDEIKRDLKDHMKMGK